MLQHVDSANQARIPFLELRQERRVLTQLDRVAVFRLDAAQLHQAHVRFLFVRNRHLVLDHMADFPTHVGIAAFDFAILLGVAWYTSRNSNNESFFIGNRNSNWMLVAFGMIGTSLSGVTFVSVPGTVGGSGFAYFQVVIGYVIGYAIITFVLLPLYYKLNLTSIYNFLQHRFGMTSYKTGALFFVVFFLLDIVL